MISKQSIFSAVRWTTLSAAAKVSLQFVQVAVLARLLNPSDYGLVAIVSVVSNLVTVLADCGVNGAYVQKQNVTPQERSSLFWLNVGIAAALALLCISVSPLLAWLFGDQRLVPLLVMSAFALVLTALGQQVRMSAEKRFDFRTAVIVEIAAAATGIAAAVIAAWNGCSVYSLLIGTMMTAGCGTILSWTLMSNGWRPLLQYRNRDVRPYIGFGGAMVAASVINQLSMGIDLLIGGRLMLAAQLGLYSVPRNLVLQIQFVINPIITRVGFPLIARVQDDVPRVREIYLKTVNMTASTNAPLYLGIAFFAPQIVHVLLGPQWAQSGPLLRLLAVWGFLRSVGNPVGSLLYGMGKAGRALWWNIASLAVSLPLLWLGSKFGPEGLSWALVVSVALLFVPAWYFLVRPLCALTLADFARVSLKPALIACVSSLPAYMVSSLVEVPVVRLAAGGAIAGVLYLAFSFVGNRVWLNSVRDLIHPMKAA